MAMPPNGESPWFHHDDVWVASDEGRTFVSLTVQVSGHQAHWTMPCIDSPYESFFVLAFVRAQGKEPSIVVQRYGADGITETPWTATTPWESLVPAAHRDVLPRRPVLGPPDGAVPIGHLRVSDAGAIELLDARGRVRSAVWRSDGTTAEAARFGAPIELCGGLLRAVMLQHPDTQVSKHESSMP